MLTDASFGIIPIRRGAGAGELQFLLIQHRMGNHWAFPKGHAEPGETAIQSAERELREETGLRDFSVRRDRDFVEQYLIDNRIRKTVRYWIADVLGGEVRAQKAEVQNHAWLSLDETRKRITFSGSRAMLELAARHLRLAAQPEVEVTGSARQLAQQAARTLAGLIADAVAARGVCHIALAGGRTPRATYAELARLPVPWQQVHVWWGDERCVPPDHAESNFAQARADLLQAIALPEPNIHRIKGELEPEAAAADYRAQLAAQGDGFALDVAVLGLGADGHTASLFPWHRRFDESNKAAISVTAHYQGRPANRVSLTPVTLNAAGSVVFIVAGAEKAAAVSATLCGPCNPSQYPAQIVSSYHGRTLWLLDAESAKAMDYV